MTSPFPDSRPVLVSSDGENFTIVESVSVMDTPLYSDNQLREAVAKARSEERGRVHELFDTAAEIRKDERSRIRDRLIHVVADNAPNGTAALVDALMTAIRYLEDEP